MRNWAGYSIPLGFYIPPVTPSTPPVPEVVPFTLADLAVDLMAPGEITVYPGDFVLDAKGFTGFVISKTSPSSGFGPAVTLTCGDIGLATVWVQGTHPVTGVFTVATEVIVGDNQGWCSP